MRTLLILVLVMAGVAPLTAQAPPIQDVAKRFITETITCDAAHAVIQHRRSGKPSDGNYQQAYDRWLERRTLALEYDIRAAETYGHTDLVANYRQELQAIQTDPTYRDGRIAEQAVTCTTGSEARSKYDRSVAMYELETRKEAREALEWLKKNRWRRWYYTPYYHYHHYHR